MKLAVISFLLFTSISFAKPLGQDVGNGGDIIICTESTDNELKGNYSLDYVLTYQGLELEEVATWQESVERIANLIKQKVPELYFSFKDFQDDIYNQSYSRPHVWEAAPFGLTQVNDEKIAVNLPDNCLVNGKFNLIQAVIRMNPDYTGAEAQIFKYMPKAVDSINEERPVQASFLFVHEWLWELSKNVDRNRRINRYLHSRAFSGHTPQQVVRELKGMGLPVTGDQYAIDSIQTAVKNASPGTTVWLLDKTYEEKEIHIEQAVKLKPKNPATRPVIKSEVKIESDNVTIEGVQFEAVNGTDITIYHYKGIVINNNVFTSYNQNSTGVLLWGESQATVTNNTFDDVFTGVQAQDNSFVTVDKNKFVKTWGPIEFNNSSSGIVQNNEISKCEIAGVDADLQQNSSEPIKVINNTFTDCKLGIWARSYSKMTIQNNKFIKSREQGVWTTDYAEVNITGNTFSENAIGAYDYIYSDGKVSISGNNFVKNKVGIDKGNYTQIGNNTFSGNEVDIKE